MNSPIAVGDVLTLGFFSELKAAVYRSAFESVQSWTWMPIRPSNQRVTPHEFTTMVLDGKLLDVVIGQHEWRGKHKDGGEVIWQSHTIAAITARGGVKAKIRGPLPRRKFGIAR